MRTFWEESVSKIFQTPSLHPKSSYCSCKNIKGCRFAGYDEIRREALKTLKRGVPWLLRVCQVTWCFGKTLKDWQTGVIIPHTRSETGKIAPTTGTYISLITLSGIMCMPNTLMREIANNWTKSGGYAPRVNLVGKLYDQGLLFPDNWVLFASWTESLAYTWSVLSCLRPSGNKCNTRKTDVPHLSRNPRLYMLQVSGNKLWQVENIK